jgi:hypothetical protein
MAITLNDKRIYAVTQEQVEYIKNHFREKVTNIALGCDLDPKRVGEVIKALNLRPKYTNTKIPVSQLDEFEEDLKNPLYTHAQLGRKWNLTAEAIGAQRKRRNIGHWRSNSLTTIELDLQDILDELDIAYINTFQIERWSIDFYLGHKICIDIHGTWAHSTEMIKERDIRKSIWLKEHNYFYFIVKEEDLSLPDLKNRLSDFYWASLYRNILENNLVNPNTQGCSSSEELTVNSRVDNTVPSILMNEGVETIERQSKD